MVVGRTQTVLFEDVVSDSYETNSDISKGALILFVKTITIYARSATRRFFMALDAFHSWCDFSLGDAKVRITTYVRDPGISYAITFDKYTTFDKYIGNIVVVTNKKSSFAMRSPNTIHIHTFPAFYHIREPAA